VPSSRLDASRKLPGQIFASAPGQTTVSGEVVAMNRLTAEERRRVRETQEKARQEILARLSAPIPDLDERPRDLRGLKRLLKTAMIVVLLGGGLIVYQSLDFHVPASIVEALLPRL
jgi:hypothetical protein